MEETVAQGAAAFAQRISRLSEEPYLRTALVKMAIRELTWALYETFPESKYELEETLQGMAEAVTTKIAEDVHREATVKDAG